MILRILHANDQQPKRLEACILLYYIEIFLFVC